MTKVKINIITYNNQYGLTNDMKMLAKLLEKHFNNNIDYQVALGNPKAKTEGEKWGGHNKQTYY